jgi:DNA-binding IclR family transcriptional regulator
MNVLSSGIDFSAVKNRPAYAIDSVDHALHLAQILRQEGSLGVSEAAERLGVARSTAHRLLSMLVYRDFAERGDDRRYRPGPVFDVDDATQVSDSRLLRRVVLPRAHELVADVNETVNLQVRSGRQVSFLVSVECDRVLRVGDREGRVLPAHQASGGKVLLAALSDVELTRLYGDGVGGVSGSASGAVDLTSLRAELSRVRRRGYAINDEATEDDVTAIGVGVRGSDGGLVAGLCLAMPSARFRRTDVARYVSALGGAARRIEKDLAATA